MAPGAYTVVISRLAGAEAKEGAEDQQSAVSRRRRTQWNWSISSGASCWPTCARSWSVKPYGARCLTCCRVVLRAPRSQRVKPVAMPDLLLKGTDQIRNTVRDDPPLGGNCRKTFQWIFLFYSSYETLKKGQFRYINRLYVRLLKDSLIEFQK